MVAQATAIFLESAVPVATNRDRMLREESVDADQGMPMRASEREDRSVSPTANQLSFCTESSRECGHKSRCRRSADSPLTVVALVRSTG